MVVVNKKKGESKDSIFRKFTKAFIDEEIVDEVRDRMFYKKPSQVNKEKEKMRLKNKKRRNR
jgi:ribosomal protein S21